MHFIKHLFVTTPIAPALKQYSIWSFLELRTINTEKNSYIIAPPVASEHFKPLLYPGGGFMFYVYFCSRFRSETVRAL
jgi:hypothetical protein